MAEPARRASIYHLSRQTCGALSSPSLPIPLATEPHGSAQPGWAQHTEGTLLPSSLCPSPSTHTDRAPWHLMKHWAVNNSWETVQSPGRSQPVPSPAESSMGFINLSMLCVGHIFSMNEFLICLFESLVKILTSLSLLLQNIMRNTDLVTAPQQGLLPGLFPSSCLTRVSQMQLSAHF